MSSKKKWSKRAGEALREAREKAELTQQALAEKAGITAACLHRTELGKTNPTAETRAKLYTVLPIEDLAP